MADVSYVGIHIVHILLLAIAATCTNKCCHSKKRPNFLEFIHTEKNWRIRPNATELLFVNNILLSHLMLYNQGLRGMPFKRRILIFTSVLMIKDFRYRRPPFLGVKAPIHSQRIKLVKIFIRPIKFVIFYKKTRAFQTD